jgi:hypothetical protein
VDKASIGVRWEVEGNVDKRVLILTLETRFSRNSRLRIILIEKGYGDECDVVETVPCLGIRTDETVKRMCEAECRDESMNRLVNPESAY